MNQRIENIRARFAHLPKRANRLFIVGGAVRDSLLGIEPKDIDFVCVGTTDDIVEMFGNCMAVHPDAPVFGVKFEGEVFEVALAREETSTGEDSEAFQFNRATSIVEDLERRDFTVNAVAVDVHNGVVCDPFDGQWALVRRVLIPVSEKFSESAERVGRAAMMIARFGFKASDELVRVSRDMFGPFSRISPEQKWRQFFGKMLSKGVHFVAAFQFLEDCGALNAFPELVAMRECQQSDEHHPEGDVLTHTLLSMEMGARIMGKDQLAVVSALLLHDMGKPAATEVDEAGNITAHGHEREHDAMLSFMERVDFPHALREKMLTLVRCHMQHDIPSNRSRAKLLRKLTEGDATANEFALVMFADINGRGKARTEFLPVDVIRFVEFAENFTPEQASKQARPLIDGNDLIAAGFKPSPVFTAIFDAVNEAFLAGEIDSKEQAMQMAREVANE